MARGAYRSKPLAKLGTRLNGMKSIHPELDLGAGLSVAEVQRTFEEWRKEVDDYNMERRVIRNLRDSVKRGDRDAAELADRILCMIVGRYGRNSNEYHAVGGTKTSERKRRGKGRKKKNAAPSPDTDAASEAEARTIPPE